MSYTAEVEGWMQTAAGGVFHPFAPVEDEVHIEDIASALSKQCRYGGHCLRFYSVAEHCVLAADKAPPPVQLTTLLHDASEAYLQDIVRPVKYRLKEYFEFENRIMEVISRKFHTQWPLPDEVKRLDNAILSDERAQNMAPMAVDSQDWGNIYPPLGVQLRFWDPGRAELMFLSAFKRYSVGQG